MNFQVVYLVLTCHVAECSSVNEALIPRKMLWGMGLEGRGQY